MKYNIKKIREEKGMTQQELADKSGVSRITIIEIEKNIEKITTTKTLLKIANALEITIDKLFFCTKC